MTMNEFLLKVMNNNLCMPSWHWGQNYFNTLNMWAPELADKVRGQLFDPFYATAPDDSRIVAFLEFVEWNLDNE